MDQKLFKWHLENNCVCRCARYSLKFLEAVTDLNQCLDNCWNDAGRIKNFAKHEAAITNAQKVLGDCS